MTNEELAVFASLAQEVLQVRREADGFHENYFKARTELNAANLKIARLESEAETAKRLATQGAELAKVRDELKRKLGALARCVQREIDLKKDNGVKTLKVAKLFAAIKAVIDENNIRIVEDGMAE